jgi:hypothetical protein
MAELQHRKHQKKSGGRKVEISGLHFSTLTMHPKESNDGKGRDAFGETAG